MDVCFACSGSGDNYRIDEDRELVCNCDTCPLNEDDGNRIELSEYEVETLVAFIKGHEREDIPDDVWELCMNMIEWID